MSSAKKDPQKRKLWTEESMAAAVKNCQDGAGLRETSRLYNVPVETLRRRVTGTVEVGCRPGPATVLTDEQEDRLSLYLIQMSEIGFGLTRDDIMRLAFSIAEKTHRQHPFKGEKAGRGWFDGFMSRHPKLTIRKPQPLSYCRALCSNKDTIEEFFGKLGSLYGRLNLIAKPMHIFNADETGVSVVHKPGKVVAELGHPNVYSLTSAEKGKTHTVLSCVSASGYVLPPLIVYPRKKSVPDRLKEGAIPNTFFAHSKSGWINKEIYLEWFKFFLDNIPPTRPILLIQDGHASHISIELIELAREHGVHLLCLPAHTTHILQPLDVGVFKSFKSHFSKACHLYLSKYPGRVITTDVIALLVAEAWPHSFTQVNILSGFRKCGIFPINPGAVSDRQLAPSKALYPLESQHSTEPPGSGNPAFTPQQEVVYERRYQEGYDLPDSRYLAWLKVNHPEVAVSSPSEITSTSGSCQRSAVSSVSSTAASCLDSLNELLVLPEPQVAKSKRKQKQSVNNKAACITDDEVLDSLKAREAEKLEAEETKKAKQLERIQKREENKLKKERQRQEREEKKRERERRKQERGVNEAKEKRKQPVRKGRGVVQMFELLTVSDTESEDEAICPKCGAKYGAEPAAIWICCDGCENWFDLKCTSVRSKRSIPDFYYCESCL